MDISTCQNISIAWYPHLVPVALAMFLAIYALIKTKRSALSILFFAFTASFSLWLIGDLIDWTQPYYHLVYFAWSWLDFINIVFFVFGAYFFATLAREKTSGWEKIIFVFLCVPAFLITVTGNSVTEFNQPVCEATNSNLLTNYKLFAEGVVILLMFLSFFISWKKSNPAKRIQISVILGAILLFFATFAGTEYISSVTAIYEINLYSLFVLPVFLIVMVFAITNLGVFSFRLLGSQILSYVLIIMTGSQLIFVQDSTHATLAIITLAISIFFGVLLLQNAQKEEKARQKIEELARDLETANKQQIVLIHFITHQIKGFVTKSRNIFAGIREGDYGVPPETMRPLIEEGFRSDTKGVNTIQEILNAANIKSGKVAYTMAPFDLKELIDSIAKDLEPAADAKHLALELHTGDAPLTFTGDRGQLVNAFKNLIDNSIKYTPSGKVELSLEKTASKIIFRMQDTGVGITPEDMAHLFTEGGHGKESMKVNVESTGFGLYIVKNIIEAHKGTVRAESDGAGKGSRFIVELPLV